MFFQLKHWVLAWQSSSAVSRKVDWMSEADCMASLVTRSNSDRCFPVGTPERARLCSPSQGYQRSLGKTSSSCDSWCQRVKACMREFCLVHCHLPRSGRRPLQTLTVTTRCPWFDNLMACAIWQWQYYLKTICHRTLVQYFWLVFNKESHYGDRVHEFRFILCVRVCVCVLARAYTHSELSIIHSNGKEK
jgi:hypothetical protein